MNGVLPVANVIHAQDTPGPVPADAVLPIRKTDLDAGLGNALHEALNGASRRDALTWMCQHVARLLHLRLVLLVERLDNGATTTLATSAENGLWLEFQRIPQRCDSGVSAHGPSAEALRTRGAVHMRVSDEGFALWRASAEGELVRELLALPLATEQGNKVLELYFDGPIARGANHGTLTVEQLVRQLESFLSDLHTIEEQQLAARALACAGNAAFVTNLEGTIVWSNRAFSELSGYSAQDVLGRNPSFLKSGEQSLRYYRELWGTIRAGKVWSGETVDRARDGSTYTIRQTVSPVSQDGRITHYVSIHEDIGREKRARAELERASLIHPVTGLLTATAFEDAVSEALRDVQERPAALVIVSMRGLQRAAGALDEEAGKTVASTMAQRVRQRVTAPDVTGTFGPYEYGLLLRGDVSEPAVGALLHALAEALNEPLPYIGPVAEPDVHFGVAQFPADGKTFRDLRLKAERKLADEPYRRARRTTE